MAFSGRNLAIAALLITTTTLTAAQSGSGVTTRYWDCCKPSCAWSGLAGLTAPVISCDIHDQPMAEATGASAQSGCNGGSAYMCSSQSPWQVTSDLAYGFAAVTTANPTCCQCYQLTFTSGAIAGKQMIVQATNTGSDVASNQFDIAMPGGGFGLFDGCSNEWGAGSAVWGAQYGGTSTNTCSSFPTALQSGCDFRWGWMKGDSNPTVNWEIVTCPAAIVAKSGCSIIGQTPSGPVSVSSAAPVSASSPPPKSRSTPIVVYSSSSTLSVVKSSSTSTSAVVVKSSSTPAPSPKSSYVAPVSASSVAEPPTSSSSSSSSAAAPPAPITTTTPVYESPTPSSSEAAPVETTYDDDTCEA